VQLHGIMLTSHKWYIKHAYKMSSTISCSVIDIDY